MEKPIVFKNCPMCSASWRDRDHFLMDTTLHLNGYQVDFDRLEAGLFCFTHEIDGCQSTMAIEAGKFFDLNSGERFNERKTGSNECPLYCLKSESLERCPFNCECAFVRDLIDIIINYKDKKVEGAEGKTI